MKTQLLKSRNPIALAMRRMRASTKIVQDKTKYNRKKSRKDNYDN